MKHNCTCKVCKKDFVSNYKTSFCSHICKETYYREYQRKRKNIVEEVKHCKQCNKEFSTGYSRQIFCSSECRKKHTIESHIYDRKDFMVFERDNFTCVYCGKCSLTDNVVLHVDHVYPLNKGGDNSSFNLVTSCQQCNTSKLERILSEEVILKLWNRNIKKNTLSFEEMKSNLNM